MFQFLYKKWNVTLVQVWANIQQIVVFQNLNLGFNEIQAVDRSLFQNLTNLEVLQLDGNLLDEVPTMELAGLNNLKFLMLQENDLGQCRLLIQLTICFKSFPKHKRPQLFFYCA